MFRHLFLNRTITLSKTLSWDPGELNLESLFESSHHFETFPNFIRSIPVFFPSLFVKKKGIRGGNKLIYLQSAREDDTIEGDTRENDTPTGES